MYIRVKTSLIHFLIYFYLVWFLKVKNYCVHQHLNKKSFLGLSFSFWLIESSYFSSSFLIHTTETIMWQVKKSMSTFLRICPFLRSPVSKKSFWMSVLSFEQCSYSPNITSFLNIFCMWTLIFSIIQNTVRCHKIKAQNYDFTKIGSNDFVHCVVGL